MQQQVLLLSNEITLVILISLRKITGINVILKDNGGTPTQSHVLTVDSNGEASFTSASGGLTGPTGP